MTEIANNENEIIENCRREISNLLAETKTKANFVLTKELLIGKYRMGERIIYYGSQVSDVGHFQSELARVLNIKKQRLSELIAFKELVDREFGSLEKFIESHDKGLEYPSWHEITHEHLPHALTNQLEEEEEEQLVDVQLEGSDFSEEEARRYFESRNGVFEGAYYRGKIPKNKRSD